MFYAKPFTDRLASVVETIRAQGVRVVIDRTVPFAAFNEAWSRQTSGRARGKVVIAPM